MSDFVLCVPFLYSMQAVAAIVGVALVAIACFVYNQPSGPVFMESAAEKALK